MKGTQRLNAIALTESGNLAGIVGSLDNLLVLDLGPNTPENFERWIARRGCYYHPDVKLYRAADSMADNSSTDLQLDKQYVLDGLDALMRECTYLEELLMNVRRPPVKALDHVFKMINMLKLIIGNG